MKNIRSLTFYAAWAITGGLALASQILAQKLDTGNATLSFKNNYLGEDLALFKSVNATDKIWINTGKPNWRGVANPKNSLEVSTPLCTDTMRGFPGDTGEPEQPGVVVCNVSPGKANADGLLIGSRKALSVTYKFFRQRLYEIAIVIDASDFGSVKSAFVSKYGEPSLTDSIPYQNGFGATWSGQAVNWSKGKALITMIEGSSNGPGQSNGLSVINFNDSTLAPPAFAEAPTNF